VVNAKDRFGSKDLQLTNKAGGMVVMTPKRIVFLVLGLLFATFIVQNSDVVQVRFLFWGTQASRALILLGAFILGIIVGWVSGRVTKKAESPLASTEKAPSTKDIQ
jgi:putative membrane protein